MACLDLVRFGFAVEISNSPQYTFSTLVVSFTLSLSCKIIVVYIENFKLISQQLIIRALRPLYFD